MPLDRDQLPDAPPIEERRSAVIAFKESSLYDPGNVASQAIISALENGWIIDRDRAGVQLTKEGYDKFMANGGIAV